MFFFLRNVWRISFPFHMKNTKNVFYDFLEVSRWCSLKSKSLFMYRYFLIVPWSPCFTQQYTDIAFTSNTEIVILNYIFSYQCRLLLSWWEKARSWRLVLQWIQVPTHLRDCAFKAWTTLFFWHFVWENCRVVTFMHVWWLFSKAKHRRRMVLKAWILISTYIYTDVLDQLNGTIQISQIN